MYGTNPPMSTQAPTIINEPYLMNALGHGPRMNVRENIIAGPNPMSYWNHSPGFEKPEIREEGPFPIQGNIGSLLKEEADGNYINCSKNKELPTIGSSNNCTDTFTPDIYTKRNTCGSNCDVKYPESYGLKDFGFPEDMPWQKKVTNSHQIHSFQNLRASMPGTGPSNEFGCYEWVPRITSNDKTNACVLNPEKVYEQVGSWNKLPMYSDLQNIKYNRFEFEKKLN